MLTTATAVLPMRRVRYSDCFVENRLVSMDRFEVGACGRSARVCPISFIKRMPTA